MEKKIKRISIALFCIYVIAVILLCVIKTDDIPELPKMFLGIPFDKIAHFIMFLPFVILGYASFMPKEKGVMRKLVVLGTMLILGFAFAVSTERLQQLRFLCAFQRARKSQRDDLFGGDRKNGCGEKRHDRGVSVR